MKLWEQTVKRWDSSNEALGGTVLMKLWEQTVKRWDSCIEALETDCKEMGQFQ